jgi:probable HAF family extracellular repeat protein
MQENRHTKLRKLWIALLIAGLALTAPMHPAVAQTPILDLGTLGRTTCQAEAITERGQVVGECYSGDTERCGFLWTREEGISELGAVGTDGAAAYGANTDGYIVGEMYSYKHACMWPPEGEVVDLGTLGAARSVALGINSGGAVVGMSLGSIILPMPPELAFLWTPTGGMMSLGTLVDPKPGDSRAEAINDVGHVVGFSTSPTVEANGQPRAFLWTQESGMAELGSLGGTSSTAYDINDLGQVVGEAKTSSEQTHAFLWTETEGMMDLGTLGGDSSTAQAVNDLGQVVGSSYTGNGERHAFLWTRGGGMVDLGTLGGDYSHATDINDVGQVVGSSRAISGDVHPVLWEIMHRLYLPSMLRQR